MRFIARHLVGVRKSASSGVLRVQMFLVVGGLAPEPLCLVELYS